MLVVVLTNSLLVEDLQRAYQQQCFERAAAKEEQNKTKQRVIVQDVAIPQEQESPVEPTLALYLNFKHPTDALPDRCDHRRVVTPGAPLEPMVFDGFDSKHIDDALVWTGHPSDAGKRDFVLSALDRCGARNANAQGPFRIWILSGNHHHRPQLRPHPEVNPPHLTRLWLDHKTTRWPSPSVPMVRAEARPAPAPAWL